MESKLGQHSVKGMQCAIILRVVQVSSFGSAGDRHNVVGGSGCQVESDDVEGNRCLRLRLLGDTEVVDRREDGGPGGAKHCVFLTIDESQVKRCSRGLWESSQERNRLLLDIISREFSF